MEDLTAASHDDVVEFFDPITRRTNASLVVAGDIDLTRTQALVEKWFSEIPPRARGDAGRRRRPHGLVGVERRTLTDRVRLPRVYLAWLTPRRFAPGDAALDVLAAVLADGKNSRLYKRLVYDTQLAQDVAAYQDSNGARQLVPHRRHGAAGSNGRGARTGHRRGDRASATRAADPARSRARANQIEASLYRGMESVGGFGGKADQLNEYFADGGGPDFFAEDLARYTALTPADVQAAAARGCRSSGASSSSSSRR